MPDAYDNNGLYVSSVLLKALKEAHNRYAVISGCAVTEDAPAAMSVDVAAGVIYANGTRVTCAGSAGLAIDAAHATLDRYDIISVNASGVVVYTAGTADANPVPPEIPATSVILAVIYVAAAVTTILTAAIYDLRIIAPTIVGGFIGAIIPWAKSLTGVPALPANWVECNGQVLSDAESPLNGQTMPNLNVVPKFIRGAATSGGTGGAETHTHTTTVPNGTKGDPAFGTYAGAPGTYGSSSASSLPTYYGAVFVICVKF